MQSDSEGTADHMIFEQHYLDCLSQASYLIGDPQSGRAVVVDPRRDVATYLERADDLGLTIELVIETHLHADFLSGHLEIAAATGAEVAYGAAAETEFASRKLADDERIELGSVTLEVRHTPGHTPESISIVVYDLAADPTPFGVLTGDTLFIGDVGRPDLLSSKGVTSEQLGSMLYDSLHDKLLTLPDSTRVYPAHGAGSACGKNLSSDTVSTIGEQRATNYALAPMTKDEFVTAVTSGQTAPPAYFSFDAQLNRLDHEVLDESTEPQAMDLTEVELLRQQGAVVLDTREPAAFAAGHVRGSINVGLSGRYSEFVGGIIEPQRPIVLVTPPGRELEARIRLARIGFDAVVGHIPDIDRQLTDQPEHHACLPRHDVAALVERLAANPELQLVDVRQPGETAAGVITGARIVPLTRLNAELGDLDPHRPTVVYCAGGFRSAIAASRLLAEGFDDVSDLLGGYGAWTDQHAGVG